MSNKLKLVSNTRIYLDANALLDHILDVTPVFPREYKYSIGARMQGLAVELIQEIAAAYLIKDKAESIAHLTAFQVKFQTLKTLVRKAGERRWIQGQGRHASIVDLMDAIGKQSTAWKNSILASMEVQAGTGKG